MSMIGNILRVTNDDLQAYLKDSSLLESRIYNEEDEDRNLTDIDKAWEGILFLLTGQNLAEADHPLAAVLFSGQLIDEDQDLGYGPAHYNTPEQVTKLNELISVFKEEDLQQRFDPDKMTSLGIYPEIWDEGNEAFEYLAENFLDVRQTYEDAAKNGEAIIIFLN
jgi:hypothetical protein